MRWPMSCPSGEGRRQGEGTKLSHRASIILSVAVSLRRRSSWSAFFCELGAGSRELGASPVDDYLLIHVPGSQLLAPSSQLLAPSSHAPLRHHSPSPLQRRPPAVQSPVLRG